MPDLCHGGSCPRRHRRNQQREIRTKRPGHLSCHIASSNHLQRSLNVQPAALGKASFEDALLVKEAVGGGFGYVFGKDVRSGCQVGDGSCELDDACACSG